MVEKSTNPDFMVKCKSAFVRGMKLKISELGKVITGNTPSKKIKEFWDKDDVGFVKPDIISDEHIVKIKSEDCNEFISNAAISKARIVPKNSIFVTCIGNIGKIGVATENLAFNQQINAIIPNENVNLDYLCYAIFANKTRLQDIANAPIVPLLNKSQFSEFELEFDMDINTQTRIVHELNTVSNIILKYKQELLLLDELVRARFVEMFGDPIYNTQNRPMTEFINVVKMQRGYDLPVQDRNHEGSIPVYGANGVLGYHDVAKINNGGIITGRSGTIGKVYLANKEYWPLNTSLFSIETYGNNLIYLQYLVTLYDLKRFVEGTGVPTLNRNMFHNKKIIEVPINEQNTFASFVEEVDKSRLLSNHSLFLIKSITF